MLHFATKPQHSLLRVEKMSNFALVVPSSIEEGDRFSHVAPIDIPPVPSFHIVPPMDLHTLRTVVHYSLHFLAPFLLALLFFPDGKRRKAYLIMFATMLVDLDHLLATPVFSPHRMSIGFHPLHSYPAIVLYALMCCLPYGRHRYLPWWGRAVAIGLLFHMFTDWQDYMWWPH